MAYEKEDGTLIQQVCRTAEDKYKRCRLLNIIQHIDIYGKFKPILSESVFRSHRTDNTSHVTSISSSPVKIKSVIDSPGTDIESKLSRLSVTTKVSGLYPGHDILSKRVRRKKQSSNELVYNVFIPR
ncbi:unnamed protein product [Arctia plantaginis]|uniref:Uncharacterized protein n=1 Tax=Arctia plantaginis TaxID=874455 RepID=A0A8S1BKX3_ARCPL|nr:unnamed protein product [Arctia plantaginis]